MLHLMHQVFKKPEISILKQLSCIVTLSSYVMTNQFEQQNFFYKSFNMSKGLQIFFCLSLQSSSFGVNEFIGRSHSDYFLVPQNFSVASFFVITKSGCSSMMAFHTVSNLQRLSEFSKYDFLQPILKLNCWKNLVKIDCPFNAKSRFLA